VKKRQMIIKRCWLLIFFRIQSADWSEYLTTSILLFRKCSSHRTMQSNQTWMPTSLVPTDSIAFLNWIGCSKFRIVINCTNCFGCQAITTEYRCCGNFGGIFNAAEKVTLKLQLYDLEIVVVLVKNEQIRRRSWRNWSVILIQS